MLPTFLVIGAPKAGTTSLYEYLRRHPQVFMSEPKELNFFVESHNWRRGRDWYESHFARAGDAIAIGEASVRYSRHPSHPGVPQRIAQLIPDARLVYLVRDPVERLLSHYQHKFRGTTERRPLEQALREGSRYLDASRYAYQIEQYLEHFPRENLLVLLSEELRSDRYAVLERTFRFLGVDAAFRTPEFGREHNVTRERVAPRRALRTLRSASGWKTLAGVVPQSVKGRGRRATHGAVAPVTLPPDLEETIRAVLASDVRRLASYVDGDFDGWGLLGDRD